MIEPTLALRLEDWQRLLETLTLPRETAAFLLCGWTDRERKLTMTGRLLEFVDERYYEQRDESGLVISSPGFVPFLGRAAELGAIPVFVHSHPGGSARPSKRDDAVDEALHQVALARSRAPFYASLIIGGSPEAPRFSGRVYGEQGLVGEVERLRVVGSRIHLYKRDGSAAPLADAAHFDRQIRAFGPEGQALLAELRVAVVGAGGTGSATFEQLVRLGVRELTVIDYDILASSNTSRVHESGSADVGSAKVEVAEAAAARIGLGTHVKAISGDVADPIVAASLAHCDLVFGCTDDHRGRNVLSKLAISHLIPVFDMAFAIDAEAGAIRGLAGRVTTLRPGAACLICRGRIDPLLLMAEALPADERRRRAEEGYVPGLGDPDPAVVAYTTLIAAWAINELLDALFAYSEGSPNFGATEALFLLDDRMLRFNSRPPNAGHWCADQSNWGAADQAAF